VRLALIQKEQHRVKVKIWMRINYDVLFFNLEKPSQLLTRIENQAFIENRGNHLI